MINVRVLSKCMHCNGVAYLPIEECECSMGHLFPLYMGNGRISTPVSGRCAEGGNRTLIPYGTRF